MGRTDDNANFNAAASAVDPSDSRTVSPSNVEIALYPSGYCVAHFTRAPVIYWRRSQILSLPYPEPELASVSPVTPSQLPLPITDPEGLRGMRRRLCKFCKNNGEPAAAYFSHNLRCPVTDKLICPVLRKHICENCGATGDDAHTRNYCPRLTIEEKLLRSGQTVLAATKMLPSGVSRQN